MSTNTPPDFFVDALTPTATITNGGRPDTGNAEEHAPTLRSAQIGKDAAGLIMTMLSDAYTDPVEAVIREICTNGIDAHTVVGQSAPVILAVPTTASPTFSVIDRGVGMSRYELAEHFADYGNSLKAGERITTGRFGIGAKSPYAVTNQFTVTTTQDGTTAVALFTIGPDGLPAHRVISETFTDDPSGTTVSIPVEPDKVHLWRNKITTVLQYITPGLVQLTAPGAVSGTVPTGYLSPQQQDQYPLEMPVNIRQRLLPGLSTDSVGYSCANRRSRDNGSHRQVVMGNIGYTLPSRLTWRYPTRVVFFAPPSSLELTHTREMIKDTEHNVAVLDHLLDQWRTELFGDAIGAVARHTNHLDKMAEVHRQTRDLMAGAGAAGGDQVAGEAGAAGAADDIDDIDAARIARDTRETISEILTKADPTLGQESHTFVTLECGAVIYRPDHKREADYYLSVGYLAQFVAQMGHKPHLLLDAGDPDVLESTSTLSRLTQAIKRARASSPEMAELSVILISREQLTVAAAEELGRRTVRQREQAIARHDTDAQGNPDATAPAPLLPMVDADTLLWSDLQEFLDEHRPPRATGRQMRGEGGRNTGAAPVLKQFFTTGRRVGNRLRREPFTQAPELSPEQITHLLETAPSRTLVTATAGDYEKVEGFLTVSAMDTSSRLRQWIHEQVHAVPIVHKPRMKAEKVASHFDAEVIDLATHLRRICQHLLSGQDQRMLAQMLICQPEVSWAMPYYRRMLTDTRLPEAVREQVADMIGDGHPTGDTIYQVIALAREPEESQSLTFATLDELDEALRGDPVARRWPLLAEVYRVRDRFSEGPSDELLELALAATNLN